MDHDLKREQLSEWLRNVALTDKSDLVRLVAAFEEGIFAPKRRGTPVATKTRLQEMQEGALRLDLLPKPARLRR